MYHLLQVDELKIYISVVVLVIGNNDHLVSANLVKNLVQAILQLRPTVKLLVTGALPRPDREQELTPVKQINCIISKKCDDFHNYNHWDVEFIAGYKIFLERLKYYDDCCHWMSITARVMRPVHIFQTS